MDLNKQSFSTAKSRSRENRIKKVEQIDKKFIIQSDISIINLFRYQFHMINNNPYNIPQKPLKQSRVVHQNPPLFPHQVNRRTEDEQKMQHLHLMKRPTVPYFMENSVNQVVRVPMSPQPIIKTQPLQMSNVTHWDNRQSIVPSITIWELNDKIQTITSKVQAQEKKLSKLLDAGKFQKSTNLTNSTSLSQDNYYQVCSKQLEKYQVSDQSIDKIREEMSCFWAKNEKLHEVMREQIKEQKQAITEELLTSFKECLNDKFLEQQKKIAEWMALVANQNQQKLTSLRKMIKDELPLFFETIQRKNNEIEQKMKEFGLALKQKMQQTIFALDQFKMNFSQFKEEVFDNMVATQDHKQWLFQLDKKTKSIQANFIFYNLSSKGALKISTEYCLKESFHLRYEQYLSVAERASPKSVKTDERTYLIDSQGYLLDSNRFYILDQSDCRIKITNQVIEKLREEGIIQLINQKTNQK